MKDCLFCKIALKEIPARIVYEDENTMGFLDINPRALGHIMVIPKAHVETILDLEEKQIEPLFSAVKKITGLLNKAFKPDGFSIGINHGKWAGQEVNHLHVHIMPRWQNDGGQSIQSVVSSPPKETLESIQERILKVN